jgi:hypothetical protein
MKWPAAAKRGSATRCAAAPATAWTTRSSGDLEIPAGKKSAKLVIRPFRDGVAAGPETIELELLSGAGYGLGLVSKVAIALSSSE